MQYILEIIPKVTRFFGNWLSFARPFRSIVYLSRLNVNTCNVFNMRFNDVSGMG